MDTVICSCDCVGADFSAGIIFFEATRRLLCVSYSMQTDGKLEIPVRQGLVFCSSEVLMAYKISYHSCASLMLGHRMLQPFSSLYSQAGVKDKPVCFVSV